MWSSRNGRFGATVAAVAALWGCSGSGAPATGPRPTTDPARALAQLTALAHDSMEGRATGTPGAVRAARFIAAEMARIGLEPAGDSGFHQRVPIVTGTRTIGQGANRREVTGPMLATSLVSRDSFPADTRLPGSNVLGKITGSDPSLANEHVIVGAHYDHVGIRAPVDGDSIYNGADDDASGVVAVLQIAERLARGPKPKRTVYFVGFIGEEVGGLGARWYTLHPPSPLEQAVAQLQIEMIARPDSLAGGFGKAWLTGYERSTMGDMLAAGGIPIVPDKRPAQNFFRRSDNYRFAEAGVVAHTLSTFNMHTDYHRPGDEVDKVDAEHMARVIDAAVQAVRLLSDGDRPTWKPGGRPAPRAQ